MAGTRIASLKGVTLMKRTPLSEEERLAVLRRDSFSCVWCGETKERDLTVDHVVPVSFGGTNDDENLETLCVKCHKEKSLIDKIVYGAAVLFGNQGQYFGIELKRIVVAKVKQVKKAMGLVEIGPVSAK